MAQRRTSVVIAGWVVWLSLALMVSMHWLVRAQTTEPPKDDPRFTGISTSLPEKGLAISRRRFEPGARSAWHFHDRGQLLFVEEGRARLQRRGEQLKEMGPGDSDYTPPLVPHWHGATPHEPFVQVAVGFGGGITWLEKTTDAEYNGTVTAPR